MTQLRRSGGFTRRCLLVTLLLLVIPAETGVVSSQEKRPARQVTRSAIGLFSSPTVRLHRNRVECGIDDVGAICANVFSSPTGAGGNWPIGTTDGYIFASGLQIAGINGPGAGAWASDTVGASSLHSSGSTNMVPLAGILDSSSPNDLAQWPDDAFITDDGLYHPSHIGRSTISEQDTWVRYWDGDPEWLAFRQHPIGLEITQRSHAWNYPHGNGDILYFVFEIRNVTHEPDFQLPNELAFFAGEDALPDDGWPIEEMYASLYADNDVADAGDNFTTAIFPFNLGLSYHGGFDAPTFEYPPDIFHPPFFVDAPGFTGAALVETPASNDSENGLTLATGYLGAGPPGMYPLPGGTVELWGTLSGKTDAFSSVAPQVDTGEPATIERSTGLIYQSPHDARLTVATGPFRLAAGESTTLVLALVFAATVETMPDGSPSGIVGNTDAYVNNPGTPSFHPGFASARGCDPAGSNCSKFATAEQNPVKSIERGAGWVSYSGPAPSGRTGGALEGPENGYPLHDAAGRSNFELVRGSLLWKSLLAHEFVASGFALFPAPPESPPFSLVPGDGTVTVVWKPSPTEENGDPFWGAASDSLSPFFNPNYRRQDIQFYRIWRQAPGEDEFSAVATFDVPERPFLDHSCETAEPEEELATRRVISPGDTVEVRGYSVGEICALDESPATRTDTIIFNNGGPGRLPGGGTARSESLDAIPVQADTLVIGAFEDVPFTWTDEEVLDDFAYRYAVTAIDLNSAYSGPTSQESELVPQDIVLDGEVVGDKPIHTVPDPYLYGGFGSSPPFTFVNLPPQATVRVYSLGGHLVRQLDHDDPNGTGRLFWDLRDRNNDQVASGVYFFHVAEPDGRESVGRFTVIFGTI